MKREWVFRSNYKGYHIEQIDPPRQRHSNWRCQHPMHGRFVNCKDLAACHSLIDEYAPFFTNIEQRDAKALDICSLMNWSEEGDTGESLSYYLMLQRGWRWDGEDWK